MVLSGEMLAACVLAPVILWIVVKVMDIYRQNTTSGKSKLPLPPGVVANPFSPTSNLSYLFRFKNLIELVTWGTETFGGIIYATLYSHKLLLVADREIHAEICRHKNLQGRPPTPCLVARGVKGGQFVGITANESKCWSDMRGFAVRAMKELGVGKVDMEESLARAANELARYLRERQSKPLDPCQIFCLAIDIPLLRLLTSMELTLEDPYLKHCYDVLNGPDNVFFKEKKYAIYNIFMGLGTLFPRLSGVSTIRARFVGAHDMIQQFVDEHRATRDKLAPRDLIDMFLNRADEDAGDPTSNFYGEKGINNLKSILVDLLGGNTEMGNWLLAQCFLYMGHNLHTKPKVEKEIREVIGTTRLPRWDDRLKMPYTEAFLNEVLRYSSTLYFGVERQATADTELRGYFIPKDTVIFSWLYGINHDKKYFGEDADKFNPDRFLIRNETPVHNQNEEKPAQVGENGCPYSFNKEMKHVAFGAGPRSCPGEFLGRQTLFIFFTTLMQQLDFKFDPNEPPPSLVSLEGHVLYPQKFNLIFTPKPV